MSASYKSYISRAGSPSSLKSYYRPCPSTWRIMWLRIDLQQNHKHNLKIDWHVWCVIHYIQVCHSSIYVGEYNLSTLKIMVSNLESSAQMYHWLSKLQSITMWKHHGINTNLLNGETCRTQNMVHLQQNKPQNTRIYATTQNKTQNTCYTCYILESQNNENEIPRWTMRK
jgi:hypothetical protein